MIEIDGKVISLDIFEKHFICDISKCKGECCVHGDSGAPLTKEEKTILEDIYPKVKPYIRGEGIKAIEEQGVHLVDADGDTVTPLIEGKECAFVIFEDGIAKCAIEKAYLDKKVDFQKPVSCHLYPIRLKEYEEFTAVNYDRWDICAPARILGDSHGVPVYKFVKDALIRYFGEEWYQQLEEAAKYIEERKR